MKGSSDDAASGDGRQARASFDRAVVEAGLVDVLTIHEADGRYLYVSPSIRGLTGHTVGALEGHSPFDLDLFHEEDVARVVDVQAEALEQGSAWRIVYRFRRVDGAYIWVESAGRPVRREGGRMSFVAVTRSADHLESLLQGLEHERRLKRQIEEVVDRQRRFLTTVSHRARTPLTTVAGIAQLLEARGTQLSEDRVALLLDRLNIRVQELLELLEDVTAADELSRSSQALRPRVVDVRALVDDVVADLGASAVTVRVPQDLRLIADPPKVERILRILVTNAFEHGGVGVDVTVRASARADGVELVVEDDGPGVPAPMRELVFEPFTSADPSSADPGAGLGLHLASELAALHGGRTWVDDSAYGGACFHVLLPRAGPNTQLGRGDADRDPALASPLTREAERFISQLLETLRRTVGMAIVYVSVFDDDHQHILAVSGRDVADIRPGRRIPLEETFCARMVAEDLDRVVPDTSSDEVTAELPPTAAGIACWIGVPLKVPSGQVVGTICCADVEPRDLRQTDADRVETFAAILGDQLGDGGFLDRGVMDAGRRVASALTSPDALHVALQPIVDLATGSTIGVEALARLRGNDRPIDLFFADAARGGLLIDLELTMVRLALERLPEIPADAYLAINVSPASIVGGEVTSLLEDQPLDRVVLEITEHAAVEAYEPLVARLAPLRRRGLRIAVDDVGTGFAGLGHLVQFHPDIVKVDRSIVDVLERDPSRRAAVAGLRRLAEEIGASLVAEGIDRSETLAVLGAHGFTHAQGYLLARPEVRHDFDAVSARAGQLLEHVPVEVAATD